MSNKVNSKNSKNGKNIKIIIIILIIILIIWFLIISPLLKFKKEEKQVLEAAKRYYEINNSLLPTGKKIRTVTLQRLYDKDLISKDLRTSYTNKECDAKTSWVKVRKENNEYKYYVYLKCGIFSSKIDHKGPEIILNGKDIVTINKGDKYKDAGVKSVIDDTDGNISTKKVTIDTKKVNTNKNGTYQVIYKVRDSFNNETIKIRTVKVEQILDKVVKKETGKDKIYKGSNDSNYIKIDGIIFKIVGLNDDGSVKVVSNKALAAVDYNGVDEWLNDYFYNKLSDSAKKYIKTDSKWCNEQVSNPDNYKKCNNYSKKKSVGLLSVADINNSKGEDGSYNIEFYANSLTSNSNNDKNVNVFNTDKYSSVNKNNNNLINPVINIKPNSYIIKGDGTIGEPYILKDNNKKLKVGEKISNAMTGEYISYSGYKWRIIGKEADNTIKVVMDGIINHNDSNVYKQFSSNNDIKYSVSKNDNIGYILKNEISSYISTKMFENKNININDYKNKINYKSTTNTKTYKSKLNMVSMYDLYSITEIESYWFINYSSKNKINCYMEYMDNVYCKESALEYKGIKLGGYLKDNVYSKGGDGSRDLPYKIS